MSAERLQPNRWLWTEQSSAPFKAKTSFSNHRRMSWAIFKLKISHSGGVHTLKAAQCERVSQMSTGPGELVGGLLRKPQLRVGRIGSNSRDFCDGKEEAPWGEEGVLRVPLGGTMMGGETHRRGAYHLYPIHGPGILPRVRSK